MTMETGTVSIAQENASVLNKSGRQPCGPPAGWLNGARMAAPYYDWFGMLFRLFFRILLIIFLIIRSRGLLTRFNQILS